LLTDILEKAIRCAYLTASIQDYVLLSLEILSKYSKLNVDHKKKIHENIQRILKVGPTNKSQSRSECPDQFKSKNSVVLLPNDLFLMSTRHF
jgi:hypothetical protein